MVDPLDGTTNFTHSVPVFAISIALQENSPHSPPLTPSPSEKEKRGIGETEKRKTKRFTDSPIHPFTDSVKNSGGGDLGGAILLGVVYEINRDECFHAYKNGGAFCNNKKITISDTAQLSESLLATGFPYADFEKMPEYLEILKTFMQNSHGLRRMGSAAVDLAYVACGIFEGFFEYNLHAWDVAAGALIVEEAGGIVTDFRGGNDFLFGKEIIAAGKIHQEMLEVISENWKK
ncbi:MAG: inositol monophosphatase [Cytophagales bacterium]|nr:inositol monophosphatase [Cytophagales bacterium]